MTTRAVLLVLRDGEPVWGMERRRSAHSEYVLDELVHGVDAFNEQRDGRRETEVTLEDVGAFVHAALVRSGESPDPEHRDSPLWKEIAAQHDVELCDAERGPHLSGPPWMQLSLERVRHRIFHADSAWEVDLRSGERRPVLNRAEPGMAAFSRDALQEVFGVLTLDAAVRLEDTDNVRYQLARLRGTAEEPTPERPVLLVSRHEPEAVPFGAVVH